MNEHEIYSDPAEIRHAIGAEGYVTIQAVSGTVEVLATDGDEAVVVARSENGHADELPLVVQRTEGGLHIEVAKRGLEGFSGWFRKNDASIEFEARVPRAARVEINTVSADINARFLAGEQTYKTVSGDLEIDPDGGRIRATSVSGDIELRAAEPIDLTVNSTSGDINVQGAVLNSFNAQTVSGDVEFEAGLAAGPMHSVETVSGDLSIESTTGVTVDVKRGMDLARGGAAAIVAGDGSARLRFRTLSGDCHVAGAVREERRHGRKSGRRAGHAPPEGFMPPIPPMPPMPSGFPFGEPPAPPAQPAPPPPPSQRQPEVDQLEVLRALERGDIDVDEAARRLQEA